MLFEQFDLPIQQFLSGFAGRSEFLDRCVYAVATYDTFKGVVMMALLWLAWFYQAPKESSEQCDKRQAHLLTVFAGSIATVLLSRVLQLALHIHQRPILNQALGLKFPSVMDPATVNAWNSFPSDHAMLSFALATGLWQIDRRIGGFAFLWSAFIIELPRVYLGFHYPSDVIAGSLLGIGCMLAFERLPLHNVMSRILVWGKSHPAAFYLCAFLATEQVAHLFDDVRALAHLMLGHFS